MSYLLDRGHHRVHPIEMSIEDPGPPGGQGQAIIAADRNNGNPQDSSTPDLHDSLPDIRSVHFSDPNEPVVPVVIQGEVYKRRQCQSIYAWVFIAMQIVFFGLVIWAHIYLKFYAPHSHAWLSLTDVYGLDTYKNKSNCQSNIKDALIVNQQQRLNRLHKSDPLNMLATMSTAAGSDSSSSIISSTCSLNESAEVLRVSHCAIDIQMGSGICTRLLYYGFSFLALLFLTIFLLKKDKLDDFSLFCELFLGLSFVGSVIYLPVIAMKLTLHLNGLKGDMALDWSTPNVISEAWVHSQLDGHCCGINGSGDHWRVPIQSILNYSYPRSCCDPKKVNCADESVPLTRCDIWQSGCFNHERAKVSLLGSTLVVFIMLQLILSGYGIHVVVGIKDRAEQRWLSYLIQTSPAAPENSLGRHQYRGRRRSHNNTNDSFRGSNNDGRHDPGGPPNASCGDRSGSGCASTGDITGDRNGSNGESSDAHRSDSASYLCQMPSTNSGDHGHGGGKHPAPPRPIHPPTPKVIVAESCGSLIRSS